MRLKSEIWISALTRRVFQAGGYAAILRRGANEAGAIFIRARHRDGTETLYGPAPQMAFSEEVAGRLFEARLVEARPDEIDGTIERESRFDPDFWLVEIDVEDPARFLDIMRA